MKREQMPGPGQHKEMWAVGLRWCSACQSWIRAEEAHRQFRCPGVVHVCKDCIEADDRRAKRIAPEARIELQKVAPPPRLGGLWAMLQEEDDDAKDGM